MDGSTVSCLQLAHHVRHPKSGSPVAKVMHKFGRADKVYKEALTRLVHSISRVLDLTGAEVGMAGADVEAVDSRRLAGAYVLDEVWPRLGIGKALMETADGRRLDGAAIERIYFA
jgi:hypothetical protein